jgi:hypothetical protein
MAERDRRPAPYRAAPHSAACLTGLGVPGPLPRPGRRRGV